MSPHGEFDEAAAVRSAKQLESAGQFSAAARLLRQHCRDQPYDRPARERLAQLFFDLHEADYPRGSVERSRFLLGVMRECFPTKVLAEAYFENLQQVLRPRAKRDRPGVVVLGTGSGRCGSTTLAAAFAALPDCCTTHENPPHIFWTPLEEQVRFHLERFRMLADYFSVVFDAAHWWLNVLGRCYAAFPTCKVIALVRDTESCVGSFLKINGRGRDSMNHWAPPANGIWRANIWSPVYPTYPVPKDLLPDSDAEYAAKAAMITRYVTEYNATLRSVAAANPQRLVLIPTEALNDPRVVIRLRTLVDVPLAMPSTNLNVGSSADGAQPQCWF